jgi:hypothetical protein
MWIIVVCRVYEDIARIGVREWPDDDPLPAGEGNRDGMKTVTYQERDIGGYQGLSVPTGSSRLSVDKTVHKSDHRSEAIRQLEAMKVAARERGAYYGAYESDFVEDPLFADAFSVRDHLLPFLKEMVNDIQIASFSGDYLECESLLQKVHDRILDLIEIDLPGYRDEM